MSYNERIAELENQLRAIDEAAGDRRLTAEEQREFDTIAAERDQLRRMETTTEHRAKWGTLQVGSGEPSTHAATDVLRMSAGEARSKALRVLDGARHLEARQGDYADTLIRSGSREVDGGRVAQLVLLTETDAYRSAFQRVLLEQHPVLTAEEAHALRAVQEFRAASLTDNAGGYGVPATLDPSIVLTGQGSQNPLWRISTVKTITSDVWKGVSSAGVSWSWDAEAEEVSDDAPTLAGPTITPVAARGFVPYSLEVGMDYPGFASEMSKLLAEGYGELTAEAFVVGAGTTEPLGIVTALDANTNVEVAVTTSGTFAVADIHKVWAALPDRARAGASWLMHPGTASLIAEFGDAYGSRTVDLSGAPQALRGRPIYESSYVPLYSATTGTNLAVVGDFSKFYIVQRLGMTVEPIPHLFGTTNGRPTGQRGLFAHARVSSAPVDTLAFRLLQA